MEYTLFGNYDADLNAFLLFREFQIMFIVGFNSAKVQEGG